MLRLWPNKPTGFSHPITTPGDRIRALRHGGARGGQGEAGVTPESTQQLKGRLHSPDHVFRTSILLAPIIYEKTTLDESTIFQENGHFCCFQTQPYGVGTQKWWLCTYFVATLVWKMMTNEWPLGVEGTPRVWTSPYETKEIEEQKLQYDFTHKKTCLTRCLWKSGMGQSSREDNK